MDRETGQVGSKPAAGRSPEDEEGWADDEEGDVD
jgi:hypothetical protein